MPKAVVDEPRETAGPLQPQATNVDARQSFWDRVPSAVSVAFLGLVFVVSWQSLLWLGITSELLLPAPASVLQATWDMTVSIWHGGFVRTSLWATAQATLLGLAIAAVAGIAFGVICAETAFGRRALQPFMVALYVAPKIAFAPILVAWLGFDVWPKVVIAALIAFFPLFVDTVAGLESLEKDEYKLFRSLGATRWQTFRLLKAKKSLPSVFAGLKTAAVLSVIGAVVGEYLSGGTGLGAQIKISSTQFAMDRVFGYVVLLSALAYALYFAVAVLEKKIVFWRQQAFVVPGH